MARGEEATRGRLRTGRPNHALARSRPSAEPETPEFTFVDIDPSKIEAYAINPDHPVGRHKYRVIRSATGLDTADAALIDQQIRDGVRLGTPIQGRADEYGQRWAVDVPLTGPTGTITVRTAWILEAGSTTPRMVTISLP